MISRVVVAVEDRRAELPQDACALDCAGEVSRHSGAEVALLRIETDAAAAELESLTPYRLEGVAELPETGRGAEPGPALGELGIRVARAWNVQVAPSVERADPGAAWAAEHGLDRIRGDLLVARHGSPPCPHQHLAQVTERMLRALELPVLLVPSGTCPLLRELDSVLVALDGSAAAERILPIVGDLLEGRPATIHLLTVVQPFSPLDAVWHRGPATLSLEGAERYLHAVAGRLEGLGVGVETHIHESLDPAEGILAEADRLGADVVALAAAAHAGLWRLVRARVVPGVLQQIDRPLLLAPVGAGPAGRGRAAGPHHH